MNIRFIAALTAIMAGLVFGSPRTAMAAWEHHWAQLPALPTCGTLPLPNAGAPGSTLVVNRVIATQTYYVGGIPAYWSGIVWTSTGQSGQVYFSAYSLLPGPPFTYALTIAGTQSGAIGSAIRYWELVAIDTGAIMGGIVPMPLHFSHLIVLTVTRTGSANALVRHCANGGWYAREIDYPARYAYQQCGEIPSAWDIVPIKPILYP